MSRHRHAYDEDDLIDYQSYDYYDEEDGDYDVYGQAPAKAGWAPALKGNKNNKKKSNQSSAMSNTVPAASAAVNKKSAISSASKASTNAKVDTSTSASSISAVDSTAFAVSQMGLDGYISPSSSALPTAIAEQDSGIYDGRAQLSDDEQDDGHNEAKLSSDKQRVTVVVAGHVDAGKSTLVGSLLSIRGEVSQRIIRKYEKESKEIGKASFSLAWVMDESKAEREHGVTIDVSEKELQTPNRRITILDAPGHKDFIPNLISGAAQANAALLVVPAATGEFESSMSIHAQTREHALLLRALGINQIILVVNKMDSTIPAWSEQRFREIEFKVKELLSNMRVNPDKILAIPTSGISGNNLVSRPNIDGVDPISWYSGPTLWEALDALEPAPRMAHGSLRATLTAVPTITELASKRVDVSVSVLRGHIHVGRSIGIPRGQNIEHATHTLSSESRTEQANHGHVAVAVVSKIVDKMGTPLEALPAGSSGIISIESKSEKTCVNLGLVNGAIIYKGPDSIRCVTSFRSTIITASSLAMPIIPGSIFELYLLGQEIQCVIKTLHTSKNATGTKQRPKCIPVNTFAVIDIKSFAPICIEPFKQFKPLGRFALRAKGSTCAIGTCEQLLNADLI